MRRVVLFVIAAIFRAVSALQCSLPDSTGKAEDDVSICPMCSDTAAALRWTVREDTNFDTLLLSYRCLDENGAIFHPEHNNDNCFTKNPNWLKSLTGTTGVGLRLRPGLLCQFGTGYRTKGTSIVKKTNCTIKSSEECKEFPNTCTIDRYSELNETTGECTYECADGFGDDLCNNINECAGNHTCFENATCIDTDGSYWCHCLPGFHKDGNHHCRVDCLEGVACDENAECSTSSLNCQCNLGFTGNGYECNDIDECVEENSVCPEGSHCTNTVGSYSCKPIHGSVNVWVIAAVVVVILLLLLIVTSFALICGLYYRFKVIASHRMRFRRGFSKF